MSLLDSVFGIHRVYEDGVEVVTRKALDFIGDFVVTDDPVTGRTRISIEVPPGIIWRGAWSDEIEYAQRDAVSHGGSVWIAVSPTEAGEEPGVDENWDLLIEPPALDDTLLREPNDWAGFAAKSTLVAADVLLLEDSAAAGAKKKTTVGDLRLLDRYRGKLTDGAGTNAWNSTTYTDVIGAAQPCASWTDLEQSGITRAGSTFTFTNAGVYLFRATVPCTSGASGIYINRRLMGSVGGQLFAQIDFHAAGSNGGGERPIYAPIVVAAGEQVTFDYAASAADAGAFFGAPPSIDGQPTSLGNISIHRIG